MKTFNVYLNFNGNCEEAMKFYAACLGGQVLHTQRFGEAPMESGPEEKDKIMHMHVKADAIELMACDNMEPGFKQGNNITPNINFEDPAEEEKIFNQLSEGGKITMPLQDTFWDARFGMLTDKFGIPWMVNCQLKK